MIRGVTCSGVVFLVAALGGANLAGAQDAVDRSITDAVSLGAAARDAGRTDEMRREVSKAAALAGDLVPRRRALAAALLDHGFTELAEQVCAQTIPRAPEDATLRGIHGIALFRLHRIVEAADALAIATAKAPLVRQWWLERARAHLHANQEAAALAAIERALALAPDDITALEVRAECEYRNRRLDECAATCRQILARVRHSAMAWQLSIRVGRSQGRADEAIKTAETAIKAVGRIPEIVIELGIALLAANRAAEAVDALREVATKLPEDPRPFLHLCKAYTKLGKAEEAAAAKQRYLELAPDLPKPQSRRSG